MYFFLFELFTNIYTLFRNTILYYFLVCIFKYCTSSRVNSGLEIKGYYFYSNNICRNSIKKITAATTTAEGKCVLIHAFIGNSLWPFSDITTSFPCAPVLSCAFPGVPVCSCVLSMHPNWRLLEIICPQYGL